MGRTARAAGAPKASAVATTAGGSFPAISESGVKVIPVIVIGTRCSGIPWLVKILKDIGVHVGDSFTATNDDVPQGTWKDAVWASLHRCMQVQNRHGHPSAPEMSRALRVRIGKFVAFVGRAKAARAAELGQHWWALCDAETVYHLDLYRQLFPDAVYLVCERK